MSWDNLDAAGLSALSDTGLMTRVELYLLIKAEREQAQAPDLPEIARAFSAAAAEFRRRKLVFEPLLTAKWLAPA